MWIVRLALRRPYTFVVMSVLIVILGILAIVRTPKDIFPDIDIPVISVIWTYNGLSTQDFEQRITIYSEFALSSNVNDIERIESQTIDGVGIIRLHFHPGVKISDSLAQATAVSQAILRQHHVQTTIGAPHVLRAVVGCALFLTITGLLGLALGSLVRNTAGGIATFAGVMFVLPGITAILPNSWGDSVDPYLPLSAGTAILQIQPDSSSLAPWTGLLLFLGYGAAAMLIAAVLLVRRDA